MKRSRNQSGFSLLEVLVAWVIVSVVLLGALGMQLEALNKTVYLQSRIQRAADHFSLSQWQASGGDELSYPRRLIS